MVASHHQNQNSQTSPLVSIDSFENAILGLVKKIESRST
jgi:hypothetical protein